MRPRYLWEIRSLSHLLSCLLGSCLLFSSQVVPAQDSIDTPADSVAVESDLEEPSEDHNEYQHLVPEDPDQRKHWLVERYERIRRRVLELADQNYAPEKHQGRVLPVLTHLEYGSFDPNEKKPNRFLVGQLHVINLSDQAVSMARKGIQLQFGNEEPQSQSNVSEQMRGRSFQISNSKGMSFGSLERPDQVVVKPGETGSTWVYFGEIGAGAQFPDAKLTVEFNGRTVELNVKHQVLGELDFRRMRIGPHGVLAVMQFGGRMNLLGLSVLADQLDSLAQSNILRTVLMWDDSIEEIDAGVMNYIYQYASSAGRDSSANRRQDPRYPALSQQLREVHLVKTPGHQYSDSRSHRQITHDDPVAAVTSALWSSFSTLSRDELLKLLKMGHLWVKPGALSAGAARLSPQDLPLVLRLSREAADPHLRRAAVFALRQFGDSAAIDRLLELAEATDDDLTPVAVASLSKSRFEDARVAIRDLLAKANDEKQRQLFKVIVNNPAPAFADLYRKNLLDENSEFRVDSLRALNAVGHAELQTLLRNSLTGNDGPLSDAAFEIILERRDPELEILVAERVLQRLRKDKLDTNIQNYLRYSKNTQAVPILLERLAEHREDRTKRQQLLTLLSSLGDERIEPLFVEIYPSLTEYEQRTVLDALSEIQSPRFLDFARDALRSEHSSLLYSAISNLSKTDSRDAEAILIEGLSKIQVSSYYDNLANAVAAIGSTEAEVALRQSRKSKNAQMRLAALNGLRYLERRKPGYQYIYQARYRMRRRDWKEALQYIEIAIEMDSTLASAFSTKGNILLKLKKHDEAEVAYQEAIALDPDTGEAIVGRLRVLSRKGQFQEAIKAVEKLYKRFEQDNEFEYQTGLLFADAVNIALGRDPDNPSSKTSDSEDETPETQAEDEPKSSVPQETLKFWTTECLSWISNAVRHNYVDRSLLSSSPELDSLKENPDLQKATRGQLPERKVEESESDLKKTSFRPSSKEGDLSILQVGSEVEDHRPGVIELPPPPAR